ncbi:hypothetical protein TNCV_510741 [Trichonephila clavipes]|nr:hypothetical protein TNCV_510741 [Trichonephila clavipes]
MRTIDNELRIILNLDQMTRTYLSWSSTFEISTQRQRKDRFNVHRVLYTSGTQPSAHRAFLSGPAMTYSSEKFSYLRYVNGSQMYMCRVEVLQAYCVCRTTDGSVVAGSSALRAVKSVGYQQKGDRTEENAQNSVAQHPMRAKGNCAYLSFRDLRRWGACADVSVKWSV